MMFRAMLLLHVICFLWILAGVVDSSMGSEGKPYRQKRTLSLDNWAWPKGIIPYEIHSSIYSNNTKLIKSVIDKLATLTCVRWLPRSRKTAELVGHNGYIRFIDKNQCKSRKGYMGWDDAQDLSLANDGCMSEKRILHEMLHAMGFVHEHSRSDRDKYIIYDPSRLIDKRYEKNFVKENTDNGVPYDLQSVMQYVLGDYSKSWEKGKRVLELRDPNLEFLIKSSDMSYYDVVRVLKAYHCSSHCDLTTAPSCKYGVLNHKCECYCMNGFKGSNCDEIDTDPDCGGYIVLNSVEERKNIESPNYPRKYRFGKICRWVITTPYKLTPRISIESLDLPEKQKSRRDKPTADAECYHWLEIQYNLPGQTGIWKCGKVQSESWTGSKDSEGTMILTFHSNNDHPAGNGFLLQVDATKIVCGSETCVHGSRIEGNKACEFKCTCDEGYVGRLCDQIKREKRDCIKTPKGTDYKGTLSKTTSGKSCLPWKGTKYASILTDDENYCRNPNPRYFSAPICYVSEDSKQYCSVSHCDSEDCRRSETGYEYDGVIHTTESGKECQRWDSIEPHEHNFTFLAAHENFCRNFRAEKNRPWCYTTDKNVEWEYCDVPKCETKPRDCSLTAIGTDYFGNISTTKGGFTCQRWDTPAPNFHFLTSIREQNNYCRNPNFGSRPWCFTTSPDRVNDVCDIPLCSEKYPCSSSPCQNGGKCSETTSSYTCQCDDGFAGQNCQIKKSEVSECLMTPRGEKYIGTMNKDENGYECERWESNNQDSLSDQENYCRNPDGDKSPWCYTTDPNQQWAYCKIPAC